jgi:hypothetical protein
MKPELQEWDRRASERNPQAGKVWWLGEQDENFTLGWASDQSLSGVAFVTWGGNRLQEGDTVTFTTTDPRRRWPDCESVRVCRVEPYGPSEQLIACIRVP